MSEMWREYPWTDEVCQDWLDQALIEARKLRFSTEEMNIYFEAHAPGAVLNYLFKAMLEGKSTGEIQLIPKSVEADLNGYLNNTN